MKPSEFLNEAKATSQRLDPKCWKGKHKEGTKVKDGVRVNNCVPNNESVASPEEYTDEAGMVKDNLHTIIRAMKDLCSGLKDNEDIPEWAQEKIAQAKGMLVSVKDYMISQHEQGVQPTVGHDEEETYDGDAFFEAYGEMWYNEDEQLDEAEYHGRKVPLGKPMQGDVKKFKVYVKDPSTGNIKKVNFGDPNMRIKKSNPARRKSFRARHNCANPGPRTKARYWSCRKW
jgi:hypothetical protein